jgi:hypothetical protein
VNVVFFSPGLTMASFMEDALVAQLKRGREGGARAVSVARRCRSQERKAGKGRLNVGPAAAAGLCATTLPRTL